MTLRDRRVLLMQILYTKELSEITLEEAVSDIAGEICDNTLTDFIYIVGENLSKIDEIIEDSLVNYSISRLNVVDKCIVRVAVGEMLYTKTPKEIIINEALEITKEYSDQGDHKAVSFNNRLLDNISKKLN